MELKFKRLIPSLFYLTLTSCQLFSPEGHNTDSIMSRPSGDTKHETLTDPSIRRLVIVGTNDFHGSLEPNLEKATNRKGESIEYEVGGAPLLARYFEILSKHYGNQLLKVDAGDIYSGTLISNMFYGESVVELYNSLQYDALTLGNHEFDYGPLVVSGDPQGHIKNNIKRSQVPFVSSNIKLSKTGETPKWKNLHPYLLKQINSVWVGIIGITTDDTPKMTEGSYVRGLTFASPKETIMATAKTLRQQGAQVILLLIHQGAECHEKAENWSHGHTQRFADSCDERGNLPKLIRSIPPKTVDAIVSGHSHSLMAYFYRDVPIIQSKNGGRYIGTIDLYYDTKAEKLLTNRTVIHPPIKLCRTFFDTTNDCVKRSQEFFFDKMVPATFLGEEIYPIQKVEDKIKVYQQKMKKKAEKFIIEIGKKFKSSMEEESELGTMMADAIRFKLKTDVALVNSGGIRASLHQGKLTFADIYKMAPFDNQLMIIRITGKELKNLIRIATSGQSAGIGIFSGLHIEVDANADAPIFEDLDGNGQKEEWERNRVMKATLANGQEILEGRFYTLGVNSFLGDSGGDNYAFIFKNIAGERKESRYGTNYRDAFIDYLHYLKQTKPKVLKGEQNYLEKNSSRMIFKNTEKEVDPNDT